MFKEQSASAFQRFGVDNVSYKYISIINVKSFSYTSDRLIRLCIYDVDCFNVSEQRQGQPGGRPQEARPAAEPADVDGLIRRNRR